MRILIIFLLFTSCMQRVEQPADSPNGKEATLLKKQFIDSLGHSCPDGYSWMPSLYHSDLWIVADQCLPDSVCDRLWEKFDECLRSYSEQIGWDTTAFKQHYQNHIFNDQ